MTMDARTERLDELVRELRTLRDSAGVSYRELATRIAAAREGDGRSPAEARIAHTTVSDLFRLGRSRINADLVAEIVRALGGDADEARSWRERVVRANATDAASTSSAATPVRAAHPPLDAPRPVSKITTMTMLVIAGVVLNSAGKFVNPLLGDVLFWDMIGTAVVAIVAGPWLAALVGVLFIAVELLKGDVVGALFAVTMISAGLIWGFGAGRFGLARTLPRFLALSSVVAITTSALAVPIIVMYFGGYAGRGLDGIIAAMSGEGVDVWSAVTGANLAISLLDKVLSGAIAFLLVRVVRDAGSRRFALL